KFDKVPVIGKHRGRHDLARSTAHARLRDQRGSTYRPITKNAGRLVVGSNRW
ncbi:hypothetical protein PanWU01x14_178420, partial [Parasponia andersonii]